MFPRFGSPHSRATIVAIAALAIGLAAAPVGDAAFPGANGRIAFLSVRKDGGLELYTVRPDGTNAHRLTQHAPQIWDRPAWSPDGRSIAAVNGIDRSVLRVGVESRRVTLLAHPLFATSGFGWSPDGRRFVYSADTGNGDIWTAYVDGTRRRRLTSGSAYDFAPAWSPNGRYIAFTRTHGKNEIEIMRADGKGLHAIGRGSHPSWSPDGRRLAFEVLSGNGRTTLATAGLDGRSRRTLVSDRSCDLEAPAWSRTGRIAFLADCDRGGRIDAVNASGRNRRTLLPSVSPYATTPVSWSPDGKRFTYAAQGTLRIADLKGRSRPVFALPAGGDGAPAWSADGTRLAATVYPETAIPGTDFVRSPLASPAWSPDGRRLVGIEGEGGETVAIVDLQTNEKSVIYEDEGIGYVSLGDPAWSPDGRLIAFSVLDTGDIAFYDVARRDFVQLDKPFPGQHPAWSPDGSRLAYDSTFAEGSTHISSVFTARPDGTGVKRIARNASDPAWSPDAKEIVFVRSLAGNRELYLMRADGTGQHRLTVNAGLDTAPDWQPLPASSRP